MAEPRKIVLILGNGFDLDLGLKTSYKNFWESDYCPKDYPAPLIHHLNQHWGNNLDAVKWYDLENELLAYYKNLVHLGKREDVIYENERKFLELIRPEIWRYGTYNNYLKEAMSLKDKGYLSLKEGLMTEIIIPYKDDMLESPVWRDRKALQLIKDGLCKYLSAVRTPQDAKSTIAFQVFTFIDEEAQKGSNVSIYTFNFTTPQLNGIISGDAKIHYLHGNCDDGKIIIGTRDDENFDENYDFLQKSFDPAFNPPALVEDLKTADEIIIFGHSIGENDRQYFKAFFKQQTDYLHPNRKDITIFTLDDHSEIQIKRALERMTDWNLSTLYGLNNIQFIKTGNIQEDEQRLRNFLVKHGKDASRTKEFIDDLLPNKRKE